MNKFLAFLITSFGLLMRDLRGAVDGLVSGILFRRGPMGAIYFNVGRMEAHGLLEVRRNSASGGHGLIAFSVSNPSALSAKRLKGTTILSIMTEAMVQGFDPIRLIVDGKEVMAFRRPAELARQDIRENQFGHAFFPQRVVSPEDAGLTLTQIPAAQ
jgi:hypothetical protein